MKISLVSSLPLLAAAGTVLAQSPDTFTPAGRMITPRMGHSATLLLDGRVLIAGGRTYLPLGLDSPGPLASAEIYDPQTKTFSPTGDMAILHGGVSVLLPSGKVLFVGSDAGQRLAAEVYDTRTGTFSVAASIDVDDNTRMCGATLLSSGKLLISMCRWWPPQDATPYLYDPASAAFAPTAKYVTADNLDEGIGPVTVLLADGKVLTIWESSKAEVYNPDTGTYFRTGDLIPSRSDGGYSATLLPDGTVLVAGGDDNPTNQTYEPAVGKFSVTGSMNETRAGNSATLLSDETVFVTGGWDYRVVPTNGAELYHPDSGTFTVAGSMITSRMGHSATLLPDGTVLIAGGLSVFNPPTAALDSAEIYHPAQTRPGPVLLSSSDGQAAVLHASTHQIVSQAMPAAAGEALEIYMTGLIDGSVISTSGLRGRAGGGSVVLRRGARISRVEPDQCACARWHHAWTRRSRARGLPRSSEQ